MAPRLLLVVAAVLGLALGVSAWAATITGTARNDVLRGTPSADKLFGKAGNDKLYGFGGNDVLTGGAGTDTLSCGAGRDTANADSKDKVAKDCEVVKGRSVDRSAVRSCLAAAGLAPENTGLRIIGSAGTNVEALGVRVAVAGRVLIFVFGGGASGYVDYIRQNFAPQAVEVKAVGNAVIAYESRPSSGERAKIEACVR